MRLLTNINKTVRARLDINAPVQEVFDFAQDQAGRKGWDPYVEHLRATKLKNGFPTLGTKVEVTAWHGLKMTCEYIKYDRPHCVTIKMLEGPGILESFAGTWRFMHLDHDKTAVIFHYAFQMKDKYRFLRPFAQLYFQWDMWRRLRALKTELEYAKRYGTHYHPA